jgi:hypothetical protein
MAPPAIQGTTLKKYRSPDSGSVMQSKSFDIIDQASHCKYLVRKSFIQKLKRSGRKSINPAFEKTLSEVVIK